MSDYNEENGIFIGEHRYKFDNELSKAILNNFNPYNMVDVGCGIGRHCKYFHDNNWSVTGIEGNEDAIQNKVFDNIICSDLTKQLDLGSFDLVLCLEVGEHIPLKYQDIFIDNIVKLTKQYLILSWAVPNQKGKGHVNCLPNNKVISLIESNGLKYKTMLTKTLRNFSTLSWFKDTIMCFEVINE